MRKTGSIILLYLLLYFVPIQAQISMTTNSANVFDPGLLLVNPAGFDFRDDLCFVSGYKLFYVSLGSERPGNFYTGLSYPLFNPGSIGFTLQSFHFGTFSQTQLDVNYAMSFWNKKLALGGRIGLFNIAYDSDRFDLIHQNDPLLSGNSSKNTMNLGVGVVMNPVGNLYLGFSANHLNRPDISLSDTGDRRSVVANLGAIYVHPIFRPQVYLERDGRETYLNVGLETWLFKNRAFLRSNYCAERLTLGAGYDFGICRFDYEYDYYLSDLQQVSNGSHQVMLSFRFKKTTKTGDFDIRVVPLDSVAYVKNGICCGQNAFYNVFLMARGNFSGLVTLGLENPRHELAAYFSATRIAPGDTCMLEVAGTRECVDTVYTLIVKGRTNKIVHRDSSLLRLRRPNLRPKISSHPTELTIIEKRKIFEDSPVLNYIFFKENESHLQHDRYKILDPQKDRLPGMEELAMLPGVAAQYRQVLNFFGRRLKDNSHFKIILVGCNADTGDEKNNLKLSRRRAESVKEYFVNVWKISPERIKVQQRNLPQYPSSMKDVRCHDENRRVEILPGSGSEKILSAFTSTMVETQLSDSNCVFFTNGTIAEAGIKNWQLFVKGHDNKLLYNDHGEKFLPTSMVWNWTDVAKTNPFFRNVLCCSLYVNDMCGQHRVASCTPIRVYYVRQDTIAEHPVMRSRLIFFAFNEYQVDLRSPRLQSELQKIVAKYQKYPGAKVEVKGYTDVIGDSMFNLRLSKLRAEEVKKALVELGIPENVISVEGFGAKFPIMTNELPEGRMMNRRVEVDVIYAR